MHFYQDLSHCGNTIQYIAIKQEKGEEVVTMTA